MDCGTFTTAKVNPAIASAARLRRWGCVDWVAVPEDSIYGGLYTAGPELAGGDFERGGNSSRSVDLPRDLGLARCCQQGGQPVGVADDLV